MGSLLISTIEALGGSRVLVTGAAGFLGSHVVKAALAGGAEVVAVDLSTWDHIGLGRSGSEGDAPVEAISADLSQVEEVAAILKSREPDIVVHCAGAVMSRETPAGWGDCRRGNTVLSATLVEAISLLSFGKHLVVVCPGSQLEYGQAVAPWGEAMTCRPYSPYGVSKLASTEIILGGSRGGRFSGFVGRFPILFGPGQGTSMLIPALILSALEGRDFKMTAGEQRRGFLFVEDAAAQLLKVALMLRRGEELPSLLNMPAPPPSPVSEVARAILRIMGDPIRLELGALPGRHGEQVEGYLDDRLATSFGLDYSVDLEDGIERTVQLFRDDYCRCQYDGDGR